MKIKIDKLIKALETRMTLIKCIKMFDQTVNITDYYSHEMDELRMGPYCGIEELIIGALANQFAREKMGYVLATDYRRFLRVWGFERSLNSVRYIVREKLNIPEVVKWLTDVNGAGMMHDSIMYHSFEDCEKSIQFVNDNFGDMFRLFLEWRREEEEEIIIIEYDPFKMDPQWKTYYGRDEKVWEVGETWRGAVNSMLLRLSSCFKLSSHIDDYRYKKVLKIDSLRDVK